LAGESSSGLLKKSEQQIPRGLKAARDDKNKRLIGTTEVVACYKAPQSRLFPQPARARPGEMLAEPCRPASPRLITLPSVGQRPNVKVVLIVIDRSEAGRQSAGLYVESEGPTLIRIH